MIKKKVLFKAPVLTYSGYGVHARQVCRFLLDHADAGKIDLYIEPTRWGNTPWALHDELFDGIVGRARKYIKTLTTSDGSRIKFDVTLQLILPNEWTVEPGAFNIGMTAGVESDIVNPKWIEACNKMNMVIVPSEFTKETFVNAGGLNVPIHVVPESYIDALRRPPADVKFNFETSFNFLTVGQLTDNNPALDRKNMYETIRTFCEAFKNDQDVGLVVKTNSGRGTKIDRAVTKNTLQQMLSKARKGKHPHVYLVHGDLVDSEMVTLYNDPTIKAFFTLTRGEGYGLPILEAAVAGIPVLATDWSGHRDFMSKGKFIPVDFKLTEIPEGKVSKNKHDEQNIWMAGSRWAEPNVSGAAKALKKFRQSPDIPKRWAIDLAERLRSEYSYDSIANMYHTLLDSILMV